MRAQVLQWMFFEQYSHEPNIAVARFWTEFATTKPSDAEMRGQAPGGYAALDAIERHLATRTFLVGERYTIADIALYAYTHVAGEGRFDLSPYPASTPGSRASPVSPGTSPSPPEPAAWRA